MYLRANFQVSSIILTTFYPYGAFLPIPQNEPLKLPPRLGLNTAEKDIHQVK